MESYVMAEARPPLATFGLTHNPFTDASEEFFGGGDRARRLEELRHLSNWPHRLLAVTGERGVGKTTMYRALSNGLDPGVKAARINANLTSDARAVLTGIIQGFGIAAPANSQPQLLTEFILLHVREQIDAKRHCLVLVDDAHLLELRALEQLLALADASADDGLRIAFFAEAYFVQSLDKASRRTTQVQSWHEVRLAPFTDDESRSYIAFRLEQAGAAGRSPFTQAQLNLIVGGSSGLPGRINAFASAVLSGDLLGADQRALPRMHRALAILVLIAAGMGWLIFRDLQVVLPPRAPDATANVPDAPADATDAGTAALAIPREGESLPPDEEGQRGPAAVAVETPTAAVTREPIQVPVPEPVPERVPEPVAAVSPVPAPPAPAKPVESAAPQKAGPVRAESWIRAQPGTHFTLQLLATANRVQRDKFLAQQDHPERFAVFQTRRDGATWYALAYGSYATRADADAAAAALPPELGRLKPWIRTFASVQATLD
jgi:DamX protein